jgi:serine/threonine protein kinase
MADEPEALESPPTNEASAPPSSWTPYVPEDAKPPPLSNLVTTCLQMPPALKEAAPGDPPAPGQRLGDFFLVQELGAGSFATVFLAVQISLGRHVALKVSRTSDNEAQTLATLEHEFIVPVYSEAIDNERHLRLLCMKFVPGTTLEQVMRDLSKRPRYEWSGQAILDAIDQLTRHEVMFDLAGLRDRQQLSESDFIEAVCWLGTRLAEALAHAHSRGVLHRDIKPANILLNHYGRPLLSDFNLARSAQNTSAREHFGGTLRYMAPEHLAAFQRDSGVSQDLVDERSDIYSLGVVLFELLTGQPLSATSGSYGKATTELVRQLEEERRRPPPSPRQHRPETPETLDRVIRRCLEPEPKYRYQKPAELSQSLEGCRQLQQWERDFPSAVWFTRLSHLAPFFMFLALGALPHILGSIVNIAYNRYAIVSDLSARQQEVFGQVLLGYNVLVYPVCIWLLFRVMVPVIRMRVQLDGTERVDPAEVTRLRQLVLRAPLLSVMLACLGWLPGGIIFPLAIHLFAGPIELAVFGHFLVSFTISGLIATSYSFFGLQAFVLRILYPRLWVDPQKPRQQARQELRSIEHRLRVFQFAAGLIPLSGAALMISVSSAEHMTLLFRLLVVGLIGLGMAGFGFALLVSSRASRTVAVMLGSGETRST